MMHLLYFSDIKLIIETDNYCVFIPCLPHIDRDDGGHICIGIKQKDVYCLQDLSEEQLYELSLLTTVVGDAMLKIANAKGIDVKLINYQINGNWTYKMTDGANLHVHLYGRAFSSKKQVFGQCLFFPDKKDHPEFYANNKPFYDEEIDLIKRYIVDQINAKYKNKIIIIQ